jgi:dipeptidyl aminopeptidase/acylaminoacyl peptidase
LHYRAVNQETMSNQETESTEDTRVPEVPNTDHEPLLPGVDDDDEIMPDAEPIDAAATGEEDVVLAPPVAGRPSVSPDGSTIAIIQPDAASAFRIWLAPIDGGEPEVLDVDLELDLASNPMGPQWSTDGAQLAVTAPHPADGRSAIWVITIATKLARVLVEHDARDSSPVWSPDGEWIAFLSRRFGRASASVVRSDGLGDPIQLSDAARGFDDHSLTWSRDSAKVAFAREAVDGEKHGDHIFTVDIQTGATKQVTTRLCGRHALTWAPDRNLIMHVADDSEWDQIAVVNADNSSGWNIAAEKGDKSEPRWSHDGQRVVYLRRHEGVVRCCERGTSTATSETIDPGNGVASGAQFLPDKRVLYVYQSAATGPRIIIQEPREDAERTVLPVIPEWEPGRELATPYYQSFEINEVTTGALVYRRSEQEGDVPAVIVLRDRPADARTAGFDMLEQAIASTGMAVYVPTLPGTPGEGRKVTGALRDQVESEAEVMGLLAFIDAVGEIGGIDANRIGVGGIGYGGGLALVLAGSRQGSVKAVAAVDPVCDWNTEFDHADHPMRDWIVRNLGLPATNRGVFAVRTAATYAGVIEAPLMLLGSDVASGARAAQLDGLSALLRELDRPFTQDVSVNEPTWIAMRRVAKFLYDALVAVPAHAELLGEAVTADSV